VIKQSREIEYLAMEHGRESRAIGWAHRGEKYALRSKIVLEEVKRSKNEAQSKVRMLEQNVELIHNKKEDAVREVLNNSQEIQRLSSTLSKIKEVIKQALLVLLYFNT
jgi:hypothetical protein